jgi:RND family efflux transporter MFP subunit
MRRLSWLAILIALTLPAQAERAFTVALHPFADEKAVFATIESANELPARTRIGGTIAKLTVHDGDEVKQGQTVALVSDEKLQLQLRALDAEITGLRAQVAQAQVDYGRAESLSRTGAASRQQFDQARTALDVANSSLAARIADRGVVAQQMNEGAVLAPTDGRVLRVPLTEGSVVLPGEAVATIAEANFVLRLNVPERHAQFIRTGDKVRLDGRDLGQGNKPVFGTITLVYPRISDGRVRADATVPGIGSYFVGGRVRVWINAGERMTYVVPTDYIFTRFGLSYVHKRGADGQVLEIPVQRGRDLPTPEMPNGIEILSGLADGDILVAP